jgi:hypothetical protein
MAERYDCSRAVTDGRHYYIRNFMPHRPRGRDTRYGYTVQANWRAWEQYYEAGKCNEQQSQFYQPKHVVELFDTESDPWHIVNLAGHPGQKGRLGLLSAEIDRWMIETRDIGLIPEPMFYDLVGENKNYSTLYEYAQSEDYPVERILEVAKRSSMGDEDLLGTYLDYLQDMHPVIRYWGAYGIFMARAAEIRVQAALNVMIQKDEIAANRIMAAQALGLNGDPDTAFRTIMQEVEATERGYVFLQGLNAFQYSHTDNRLTREDWVRFKNKQFPEQLSLDHFGVEYAQRIINDALAQWPSRRAVY